MDTKVRTLLIPAIVAAGIIVYLIMFIWDRIPLALEHFDPVLSIAAIIICAGGWIVRGERYRFILDGLAIRTSSSFSIASIFASQTANLIAPARLGDLVRVYILKHEGLSGYSQGFSSLVVERIFDIFTIALLGFIAINFVFNVPSWAYTFVIVPFVGGGIFLLLMYALGMVKSDNRYIEMLFVIVRQVKEASLKPRAVAILSLSSILVWLGDIAVCGVVVAMFGESGSPAVIILAIAMGNLVKAVPITPGGLGTYELTLASILALAGIPFAAATLIAFIDHLIKNLVTLGGGILSVYVFGGWVGSAIKKALKARIGEEDFGS
ncbi:MAG: lysylphosphatidylglycerol synthase transmembrane domain-containing protein [Methanomicrobiales archaeon]|nr:lysylphosphatidylglycerol synthase transmembrane domain-containing protein [Methanomicrobiales archaeon]